MTTPSDDFPAMLTVREACAALRISLRVGYELANEYLETGGESGLPVIRLGKRVLRVPRRPFEARYGLDASPNGDDGRS